MTHRKVSCVARVLLLPCVLAWASPVFADPTLREQRDVKGDFVLIGNTMAHECEIGMGMGMMDVPEPIVGDIGSCPDDNPYAPDVYWRADAPTPGNALADEMFTPGQARTTAVLNLPEDAEVVYARLYWAALSDASSPDGTARVQRRDVGLDTQVTADDTFEIEDPDDDELYWYHSTADVTALVQAQGEGPYRIAGVDSVDIVGLGSDNAVVAWAMVVMYEKAGDPPRNLAIFDGFDLVDEFIGSASATLEGFLVPDAGFDAKLGVIAYEGEQQFEGDSLLFNGEALENEFNPSDDFFNATRTVLGELESNEGDLPRLTGGPVSLSNVDLDVVSVTELVERGDTSATIEATSTSDTFLLGAFVTSISTFKPELTSSSKEVVDENGGAIRPGDTLVYRIRVRNTGNDTAIGSVLTDPLPDGVTYVPGSIVIEAGANEGAKTDAEGDDEAEHAAGVVTVRLGDGADDAEGGELEVGAETTVAFRVAVDLDAEGVISNQATITAEGEQGAPSEDTVTDGNGDGPGQPPTDVVIGSCDDDDDCTTDARPLCDVGSSPRVCVECVTSAHCKDEGKPDCSFDTHVCECASGSCGDDTDGDGISDSAEEDLGTDPDDADSDDDGASDGSEIAPAEDTDGDGLINALDADSDNDALFDGTELGLGCDESGTDVTSKRCRADADSGATKTSPVDADTDGGGVSDGSEDADLDGEREGDETDPTEGAGGDDAQITDTDGDGLGDALEEELHADPMDADTDNDGVPDGDEQNPSDDVDGDGLASVLDVDSDNDALFDGTELGLGCGDDGTDASLGHCRADNDGGATVTFALRADTDDGGAIDGNEDTNLNGVVDSGESDPVVGQGADDIGRSDTDGDGLGDALEMEIGTDLNDADSDEDGVRDGLEPNPSDDHDGDGQRNALDSDSDDDGLFDGTELGLACDDPATSASAAQCEADEDSSTRTSPIHDDTDFGGKSDGAEDENHNGAIESGESDPNDGRDDRVGDACTTDSECGAMDGGVICLDDVCAFGCRGMGGNTCPDEEMCSSTTADAGTCEMGDAPDGGVATGGAGGATGGSGGAAGSAGTAGSAGSAGQLPPNPLGTLGGGGCDCRAIPASHRAHRDSSALLVLAGLGLFAKRVRNRRRAHG